MKFKKVKKYELDTLGGRGVFVFIGLDGKKYKLSLREKKFCENYLQFSGNGTQAYLDAYKCKSTHAGAGARNLLIRPRVMAYINARLDDYGFSDKSVEKQHLFTLNQFSDLNAKNKAIDMYYKKKGLYAPEKHEVKHSGLEDLLDEISNAKQQVISPNPRETSPN